ncbi:hypothetical protein B0H13DRAFT_1881041 [Mycena leptocephala]|nr:hypothetical protein B0H13DRAFT_1881041 [Mycena leptocephala]
MCDGALSPYCFAGPDAADRRLVLALGYCLLHSVCCLAALCPLSVAGRLLPAAFPSHLLASTGPHAPLFPGCFHIHTLWNVPVADGSNVLQAWRWTARTDTPQLALCSHILGRFSPSSVPNRSGPSTCSVYLNRAKTARLFFGRFRLLGANPP